MDKKVIHSEIDRTRQEMVDVQVLHYRRKVMTRDRYYSIYHLLKDRLYNLIKLKENEHIHDCK